MENLWEKTNYQAPINYIIDYPIYEYDISKANINVLREALILTEGEYWDLYNAPKLEREKAVGLMERSNPNIAYTIKTGIANARKTFLTLNSIQDSNVLSIKNDSITILGDYYNIKTQVSGRINFRLAGNWRSFYRIGNLYFFYDYNRITNTESLEVKGLGRKDMASHEFMLDFLSELFYTVLIDGIPRGISLLSNFYNSYSNKQLPVAYYRELNPDARFKMIKQFSMVSKIYMDFATEYEKPYIDISYNEQILREFNKILSQAYFKTIKPHG